MGPKRTIDRRRHTKGTVAALPPKQAPAAAPANNDEQTESEDSSVDIPTSIKKAPPPAVAAAKPNHGDSDSSVDTPKKQPAVDAHDSHDDEDDDQELKSDSSGDDNEHSALQDSSDDEPPPTKKKKQIPTKTSKKKPAGKKPAPRPKKAPPSDDEEEEIEESESAGEQSNVSEFDPDAEEEISEESEESWDDEEEIIKPKKRGRPKKAAARGQRKNTRRGRKKKQESDDESEDSWNSEEEDIKPKRGRPKRTSRATRGRRKATAASRRRKNESDSEESWNSNTEDGRKSSYKTPRSTRRKGRASQQEESSEEDDDDSPRRSTPSRRSAAKALARISDNVEKDEKVEEEETEHKFPMTRKRRKKKSDEDDEFDPEAQGEEDEGDDDDVLGDDESSASSAAIRDAKQYEAGNVDAKQDFLTADSSEDENAPGPSPMLDIKSTPRRRRSVKQDADSFASSSESDDNDERTHQQGPTLSSSPHMPACPSEIDAITMDPLPEKHLCYFSPDFQSRQCFALETLHKIAMNSSVRGLDGKRTFLQPPHFRSPASDDFIDQIASRFGRSALDLTGNFYNRGLPNRDGYMLTIGANLANEETFQERLNDYISNLMGSQDIYCCPLCYIESHRRLEKRTSGEGEEVSSDEEEEDDDPEEPGEDENGLIKLWHDPMTVLGFPDNEKYALASTFCFTKISDVKRHLREAHHVDTKVLDSNDLFARFKVRVADGLLQRYIEKTKRGRTFQGDMRRYWNMGNNQIFVYLIYLMKRRAMVGEDVAAETPAQDFYRSFENRAKRTWETLSAPYRKATKEELNEFIEEGDVEEEEDAQPHFAMHREMNAMNPADEIAEALKQRRLSQGGQLSSGESSIEEEEEVEDASHADSNEDEANPDNIPGYYSEEEEEEDDWVTSRLAAAAGRRNSISPSTSNTPKSVAKGKRLGKARDKTKRDGQPKHDDSSPDSKPPPAKKAKRSLIIESDSDEN